MPEKEIEKLQAEKEKVERQLAQEQHIHIKYDGLGFIPLGELMKKETA